MGEKEKTGKLERNGLKAYALNFIGSLFLGLD